MASSTRLPCRILCIAALLVQLGGSAAAATNAEDSALSPSLLSAIDVTRPGLATVREQVGKGDIAAANHAFAEYLRTRRNVNWHYIPESPPSSPDEITDADDAVKHSFKVVNISYQFPAGARIDWKFNPTALPDSKNALNHEWTWQFNRMYFWPPLAHAYRATGKRRYADELTSEILSWIADNPVPDKAQNVPYSRWRTIEAGIRMFNAWPEVFFTMLGDRKAFPDEVLLAMVNSMREHAEYLDKYPTAGNWKTMESNGLFHVGVLLPEFKSAAKWREDAIQRQHEELGIQVYPDGTQRELAPGYHNVALKQFVGTLDLARLNNIPLPADYATSLEKMFDVNLYLCMPDRTYPNFNDSGRGNAAAMLAEGLRLFPKRDDWRWIVTDGKRGKRPDKTSYFFPNAGFAMMRSSWERDALCLAMDLGPYSTGHQHDDKLSFILDGYGSHLLAEAGIVTYDASPMRKYSLGPAAHNTVFIDGMGENRRAGPPSVMYFDPKLPLAWSSDSNFDYVMGTFGYHEGERWGPDRKVGFIQSRRILFVKPSYFVVIDTITPPKDDSATHLYEALFHLDTETARIDAVTSCVRTAQGNRAGLTIVPLAAKDLSVRIVKGQTDPVMQGWISDHAYDKRAVPTAIISRSTSGPISMLYVFAPSAPGKPSLIDSVFNTGETSAALSANITLRDHAIDDVRLADDGTLIFRTSSGLKFSSQSAGMAARN